MGFITLPPGLAKRLIAGEVDELTPLAEARMSELKRTPCTRCGGNMHPELHTAHAYSAHDPLPRTLARCTDCGRLMDPRSGLILETGNPANIEDPFKLSIKD